MASYGPVFFSMVLYVPVWYLMVLYSPVLPRMVLYGLIWSRIVQYGLVWSRMVPQGPVGTVWYPCAPIVCIIFNLGGRVGCVGPWEISLFFSPLPSKKRISVFKLCYMFWSCSLPKLILVFLILRLKKDRCRMAISTIFCLQEAKNIIFMSSLYFSKNIL